MTIKSKVLSLIVMTIIAIFGITETANAFTLGQRGGEVADLQITLIEAGFDIPAITSGVAQPGYFGVQTQKALALSEASKASKPLTLGSVTGPDSYLPYRANNDVKTFEFRTRMTPATSTPCSFFVNATSSLDFFSARVSSSTSVTATAYTLATSTLQNATTSLITYFGVSTTTSSVQYFDTSTTTIAASAQGTLTYRGANNQSALINSRTYITLGVQGGLGTFGTAAQVGGVCNIRYTEL